MITLDMYKFEKHHTTYPGIQSQEDLDSILEYCKENDIDISNFYLYSGGNAVLAYAVEYMDYEKMVFVEMFLLDPTIIKMMDFKKHISTMANLWESRNVIKYLSRLHRRYYGYFIEEILRILIHELSDEIVWDCFEYIWVDSEYLNNNIDKDDLIELFECNVKIDEQRNVLRNHIDEDGYLTIYRGEGTKSKSHTENGLSWSISLEKAQWFANRFSGEGIVYQTKIRLDEVLAYFDCRGEEEVIFDATYHDLEIIEL